MTHTITKTRMYLADYLYDHHVALSSVFECLTRPLATEIAGRAFVEPVIFHADWKTKRNLLAPDRIEYIGELHWMPFSAWANENLVVPDAEFITSIKLPLTNKNMLVSPKYLRIK